MSTLKAAFWPGQSHHYGCIHPKCNNNKLYCVSNGSFHLSQGTALSRTHSPGVASKYFLQSSLLYISIQMQTRLKEKLCTRICNSLLCFCFAICCQIKTKNIRLLANWIPSSALIMSSQLTFDGCNVKLLLFWIFLSFVQFPVIMF